MNEVPSSPIAGTERPVRGKGEFGDGLGNVTARGVHDDGFAVEALCRQVGDHLGGGHGSPLIDGGLSGRAGR